MMNAHSILVQKTAHYYTLGQPGPKVRQVWFVCHGYAQTADRFLENFRLLDNEQTLVIAPEGFNHFYKKGFSGDVGASWMTNRQRDNQIADYAFFLQSLYEQYIPQLPKDVRIVLFGFSQGTATVCRWALRYFPAFHDLLLWAGLPPEDLDYRANKDYLANKNLYLLYGTTDPFLTPDRMSALEAIEEQNDVDFDETSFQGGHEIPEAELRRFIEKLQ